MKILNALLKATAASAVLALGLAGAPAASAQGLSRPSTEGMKAGPPATLRTPTDGMHYNPSASTRTPTDNIRYNPAVTPAPLPAPRPAPAPAPRKVPPNGPAPTAEQVVGTWLISAKMQLFDLKITSITGNRIWYTTSRDGRPRLGVYNALTGSITFSHTDLDGDTREFTGKLRIVDGKFTGTGTSTKAEGGIAVGLVAMQIFGATKK